jgi:ZIP family zinc transporter
MEIHKNFWSAILLTTLSGFSTSIGGLIVIFQKKITTKTLGHLLSFSAGVMIFISFVDILFDAIQELGYFIANLCFFFGMLVCKILIDFVPKEEEIITKKK